MNKYLIMKKPKISVHELYEHSQELQQRSKELQERSKIFRRILHECVNKSKS